MPKDPLISIITVNLNNLEGLKRTMSSVLAQTYQEFEYIVIDGGSLDGSKEYIQSFSIKLSYWISELDKGIYNGMNKGIVKAKGEYLLFLNSGDEFHGNRTLEDNFSFIHTEDLIYFNIKLMFENHEQVLNFPRHLNYIPFIEGSIGHPSTFIKRELFKKIGCFDENLKIVSDWKFFFTAIAKFHCSSRKVNTILVKFYKDGISTKEKEIVRYEREKVLKQDFPEFLRLNELERKFKDFKNYKIIKFLRKLGYFKRTTF